MRIGIISDTHGKVERTRRAIAHFESECVERVIHCGDIGTVAVVELFTPWETHFVFGNVDHDTADMQAAMEAAGHVCHGRFGEIAWDNRRIAVIHGDEFRRLRDAISSGQFDLVCCGHTHQKSIEFIGQTRVLNPGAIDRVSVPTVAIVDLPALQIRHLEVQCDRPREAT